VLVAAAVLAAAIFIFDTVTPYGMAIAVLYVIVVLVAGSFLPPRGILVTAAACAALTVLSYELQHADVNPADSLGRALMSLSAIGVTTLLVLRNHSAQAMRREQARLRDLTHDTVFVRDMRDIITYFQKRRRAVRWRGHPAQHQRGRPGASGLDVSRSPCGRV